MPTVELLAAIYPDAEGAARVLSELDRTGQAKAHQVLAMAVISRGLDGVARIIEPSEVHTGRGSLFGALVGSLIGLLGGPAGAAVGALAGAATGGLVAHSADSGFEDDFLEQLQTAIQPGHSVLLALVERSYAARVGILLGGDGVRLLHNVLRKDVAKRLWDEQLATGKAPPD